MTSYFVKFSYLLKIKSSLMLLEMFEFLKLNKHQKFDKNISKVNLSSLPTEILFLIMKNLNTNDIIILREINSHFKALVDEFFEFWPKVNLKLEVDDTLSNSVIRKFTDFMLSKQNISKITLTTTSGEVKEVNNVEISRPINLTLVNLNSEYKNIINIFLSVTKELYIRSFNKEFIDLSKKSIKELNLDLDSVERLRINCEFGDDDKDSIDEKINDNEYMDLDDFQWNDFLEPVFKKMVHAKLLKEVTVENYCGSAEDFLKIFQCLWFEKLNLKGCISTDQILIGFQKKEKLKVKHLSFNQCSFLIIYSLLVYGTHLDLLESVCINNSIENDKDYVSRSITNDFGLTSYIDDDNSKLLLQALNRKLTNLKYFESDTNCYTSLEKIQFKFPSSIHTLRFLYRINIGKLCKFVTKFFNQKNYYPLLKQVEFSIDIRCTNFIKNSKQKAYLYSILSLLAKNCPNLNEIKLNLYCQSHPEQDISCALKTKYSLKFNRGKYFMITDIINESGCANKQLRINLLLQA